MKDTILDIAQNVVAPLVFWPMFCLAGAGVVLIFPAWATFGLSTWFVNTVHFGALVIGLVMALYDIAEEYLGR